MTAHTVETQETGSKLKQAVTGPLLFLFILGDVLGAGIYALMGVLADQVGGVLWLPLVVALLLALLTAGSYAELVTKFPRAGGAAVFAERAFGKPLATTCTPSSPWRRSRRPSSSSPSSRSSTPAASRSPRAATS
jgi:APA family basic amino acid/polyamine antiporter